MKKLDLIKAGAEILVSTGVGSIVGNAIKITTSPDSNRFTRIAIGFGGFVLSSMISAAATAHVNGVIDDIHDKVIDILRSEEDDKDVQPEDPTTEDEMETSEGELLHLGKISELKLTPNLDAQRAEKLETWANDESKKSSEEGAE